MRKLTFVYLLLFTAQAFAGTYETVDGNRNQIKNIDGTPHKRSGDLGPGKNLRWAGLQKADLRDANLCFTDLRNANLEDANLTAADLHGSFIGGASLRNANLNKCLLGGSELDGADFRGVQNWQNADWKGARYKQGAEPQWPQGFSPERAGIIVLP